MRTTRRRALNILLVISLGANLLVFGGMGARYFDTPNDRPTPPNLFWVLRNLEEDTQARLRPVLEKYADEIRPMRAALFQAQREVNNLLTEDPLNTDQIASAFAALRAAGMQYQDRSHEQTLEIFAQMNPEERVNAMRYIQERSRAPRDNRDENRTENRTTEQAR